MTPGGATGGTRIRVLFVDDDERILSGFRRMLARERDWKVLCATSAADALELAARQDLDVIVADMQMPKVDGAALLAEMRRRYPAVTRIILSGHIDEKAALRAAGAAQRYLAKPCRPETLVSTVRRARELQEALGRDDLRRLLGGVGSIPTPPTVITELNGLLDEPEVSIERVEQVIASDIGISAKVLQLVNSAFFGTAGPITGLRHAIVYLGLDLIHQLVVSEGLFRAVTARCGLPGETMAELRAHSETVSMIAGSLAATKQQADAARVAGILHDIGWLVLAEEPERIRPITAAVRDGVPLHLAEERTLGVSHARVGALLLSLWGLPAPLVEAVAHHHDAPSMPHRDPDLAHLVYLADCMARHSDPFSMTGLEGPLAEPDPGYVEELGMTGAVTAAREAILQGQP